MESLYEIRDHKNDVLKNQGYDYTNTLMNRTLSNYLFRNEKVAGYLQKLNAIMVYYLNSVKTIRVFYNFTVPKNYQKIN
jgi:hypothetical protein